jgi:hypothetical protein
MTTQWLAKQYKATLHDLDMSRGKKLRVLRAIRRELRRRARVAMETVIAWEMSA